MARLYLLQLIAGIAGGFIAVKKGRSALFWSLLCFIFPPLVLIILMLPSFKTKTAGRRCPNCSHPLNKQEDRCSHCSWQKPIELIPCRSCGSFVSEQENCPTCRRKKTERDL